MAEQIAIWISGVIAFLIIAPIVKWYVEGKEEMEAMDAEERGEDDVDR